MTEGWAVFSILAPVIATVIAGIYFRSAKAEPTTIIILNALMPGCGLAAAHRPMLEIIAGVFFSQLSLLSTRGLDNIRFVVPSMIIGAGWGLVHTRWTPFVDHKIASPPPPIVDNSAAGKPAAPVSKPRSATVAAQPASDDQTDLIDGYAVTVNCTECGADVDVPVLEHMARCPYCGSDHMVVGHDEVLYVTIPERVTDDASLRSAILEHFRYLYYLKLYKRHVAPLEGQAQDASSQGISFQRPEASAAAAAAEKAITHRADQYRAKLDSQLEIGDTLHFLAPYRHGMGTIYQAAFGRSKKDQNKKLRFAMGTIEAAVGAFDHVSLPKMGKLSYLRALTPAAKHGSDLKALPLDTNEAALDGAYGNIDRKQLIRDINVISMGTAFSQEVSAVVWRPWWIAAVSAPGISQTLLVDSAAASVSGVAPHVDPELLETLPAEAREPGAGLRFLPMECPTCGFEFNFEPSALAHFCRNCHRVFAVEDSRKVEIKYSWAEPASDPEHDLVPFWEFPLRIRTADGNLITDLSHLRDGIDGTMDQLGDDAIAGQDTIFVPAIRCINSRLTAQAFNSLFRYVLKAPPHPSSDRIPLDVKPHPLTVSLDEDDARNLAPLYLANAFTKRDIARVNVHQVGAWLFNASLEARGRIAFLPIHRTTTEPFKRYLGRQLSTAVHQITKGRLS